MNNERRIDDETRERLNEIQEGYERDHQLIVKAVKRTGWIQVGFTILIFIVVGLAQQNRQKGIDIQEQRKNAIYNNCIDQNKRNVGTIKVLDTRLDNLRRQGKLTEKEVQNLKNSREFTVLLIDALAPYRDCNLLVKQQTKDNE